MLGSPPGLHEARLIETPPEINRAILGSIGAHEAMMSHHSQRRRAAKEGAAAGGAAARFQPGEVGKRTTGPLTDCPGGAKVGASSPAGPSERIKR